MKEICKVEMQVVSNSPGENKTVTISAYVNSDQTSTDKVQNILCAAMYALERKQEDDRSEEGA